MSREQRGACQFSTAARWRLGMCDVSCHRVWLGLFPIPHRDYVFFLLCDSLDSLIPCFGDEECKISILFSYVETNAVFLEPLLHLHMETAVSSHRHVPYEARKVWKEGNEKEMESGCYQLLRGAVFFLTSSCKMNCSPNQLMTRKYLEKE